MAKKTDDDSLINITKELTKLECKMVNSLDEFESPLYISSGLFSLDLILSEKEGFGVSCVEISGGEGVGKTSLVLATIAELQKTNKLKPYYINIERGLTKGLIGCFNVNASKVSWINPNNGTAAINAMEFILKSQPGSLVVLDSVPACLPSALYDEEADKKTYAPVAGLFNNFMPKARMYCQENHSILILLNQLRDNMNAGPYGPPDRTPGGRAIKFYCDCRIALKKRDAIKRGDEKIGHLVRAEIVKNRFHKPFQSATLTLIYGQGFDLGAELFDTGVQMGIIGKEGAYYTYGDDRWHGGTAAAKAIIENKTLTEKIKAEVRKILK